MSWEGHAAPIKDAAAKAEAVKAAVAKLTSSAELCRKAGLPVGIVSCGGTGDYSIAGDYAGVTENQAGSYLLMDTGYAPFAPDFKVTLSVLVTVISKTAGERLVVDAGCKAISSERGLPSVKGIAGLKLSKTTGRAKPTPSASMTPIRT